MKRALLVALAAAACSHAEPYGFVVEPLTGPHQGGAWEALTHNAGEDLEPAWFVDGDSFIYTTERLDREDHDRCLATMRAAGGTVRSMTCERKPSSADTMDVLAFPSPGPDGRVAFLYTTFDLFRLTNYYTRWLVVGTLDSPLVRRNRWIPYPYIANNGGYEHDGIDDVRWLTPTLLAYIATRPAYPLCKTCRPDAATPVQIVLADLSGDTAVTRSLDSTVYANSLASVGSDTLYYTALGNSVVRRRVLSTGADTVIRDYGLGVIARDVQVRGTRMVVIVGGSVAVEFLPGQGWVQNDDGGLIHVIDLATGADSVLDTGGRLFRRGALSPDGQELLAESRFDDTDDWDIWRVRLP